MPASRARRSRSPRPSARSASSSATSACTTASADVHGSAVRRARRGRACGLVAESPPQPASTRTARSGDRDRAGHPPIASCRGSRERTDPAPRTGRCPRSTSGRRARRRTRAPGRAARPARSPSFTMPGATAFADVSTLQEPPVAVLGGRGAVDRHAGTGCRSPWPGPVPPPAVDVVPLVGEPHARVHLRARRCSRCRRCAFAGPQAAPAARAAHVAQPAVTRTSESSGAPGAPTSTS